MDTLEEVARKVARGDSQAFALLVNATSDSLVRLSARIVGTLADAEDVVQEAYMKAFRALVNGQFDARSSVKTWLYRIVTHASIDALRRNASRQPQTDVLENGARLSDGLSKAEARLALAELSDWLQALPADQRAAIVLQSLEGLSTAEIALITDSTEGAVEQRLVRARATLRRQRSAS